MKLFAGETNRLLLVTIINDLTCRFQPSVQKINALVLSGFSFLVHFVFIHDLLTFILSLILLRESLFSFYFSFSLHSNLTLIISLDVFQLWSSPLSWLQAVVISVTMVTGWC